MKAMAVKDDTQLGRPLKVLISLIRDEIDHAKRAVEEAWKPFESRVGEYLLEARPQVPQGQWESWVTKNFEFSVRTAHNWMQYAKKLPEYQSGTNRSDFVKPPSVSQLVRGNQDFASEPARSWQPPVRQILTNKITPGFVERMAQEKENSERELKLIRDLTIQMIDIGYKVLATKLHPDKGGEADAMSRLTRAKNRLKKLNSEEGL